MSAANDEAAFELMDDGTPFMEAAVEMEVGPCVRCGRGPEEYEGGLLENSYIEDGVVKGDNVCLDCVQAEDPDFTLEEFMG